ncbi:hypothetical protein P9112_000935 [Eukaryota sp. TZLM1-RC]
MTQTSRRFALRQAENIATSLQSIDHRLDSCLTSINSRFSSILQSPPQLDPEITYGLSSIYPSRFETLVSLGHFIDASIDRANRLVQDDSRWRKNLTPQHMLSLLLSGNLTRKPSTELTLAALELNSGRRLHERLSKHRSWSPGPTTQQHADELEKFCKRRRKDLKQMLKQTLRHKRATASREEYLEEQLLEKEINAMEIEDLRSRTAEEVKKEQENSRILATELAAKLLQAKEESLTSSDNQLSEQNLIKQLSQAGRLKSEEVQEIIDEEQKKIQDRIEEEKRRSIARSAAERDTDGVNPAEIQSVIEDILSKIEAVDQEERQRLAESELAKDKEELIRQSIDDDLDSIGRLSFKGNSFTSEDFSSFVHDKLTRAKDKFRSFVVDEVSVVSEVEVPASPLKYEEPSSPRQGVKIPSSKIKELLNELSREKEGETDEEKEIRLQKLNKLKRILKKRISEKKSKVDSPTPTPTTRSRSSSFAEFISSTTSEVLNREESVLESQAKLDDVSKQVEEREKERRRRREAKQSRSQLGRD